MITDFNAPNRPVIIGLDHGYGNMKTAHACFQTGVTRHEKEPTFKSNMLFYDGWYYTIGEDHKEFTADKMNDPDYFILTLASIASELAFYGRQSADVHLAVGLPLTWVAEQKDDFKKYLMQRDSREQIAFTFQGEGISHPHHRRGRVPAGLRRNRQPSVRFQGRQYAVRHRHGRLQTLGFASPLRGLPRSNLQFERGTHP